MTTVESSPASAREQGVRSTALKYLVHVRGGMTPSKDKAEFWSGEIPWVSPKDMKCEVISDSEDHISTEALRRTGVSLIEPPAVIMVTRGMILDHSVPVALTNAPVTLNQDMKALVPRDLLRADFLAWLLRAKKEVLLAMVEESGHGTKALRSDLWRALPVDLPPLSRQRGIATFLDRTTAAIDALIAKKERLIELLQEKRHGVITRAVTRGLDSSAPTKDSGVRSLGVIPKHWTVRRLMHLTPAARQIMYGIVLPGPNFDGGVPIIKSGDCFPEKLTVSRLNRTDPAIEAAYVRSRVRSGDVVIAIRGSVGASAMVPDDVDGANLTQDAARIAPSSSVSGRWLLYALQSTSVWSQLESAIIGATVKGLNIRDLKRGLVPVPPPDEQADIAAFLDRVTTRLDQEMRMASRSIALLREYRQALISAAVTGKIDIPAEEAA